MFHYEFFPTPRPVIAKMYDKITNKNAKYFLEPSAGKGDIAEYIVSRNRHATVECIEQSPELVSILNDKGFNVVGFDWLEYDGVSYADCIVMNPPFSNGDAHLLRAWEFLYTGEIVCLLNEETIKNPCTAERKRLAKIIEENGSVEFLGPVFSKGERKTGVNVALVYLKKQSKDDSETLWVIKDEEKEVDGDIGEKNMLAIKDNLGNMQHYYDEANTHMFKALEHIRKAAVYMGANGVSLTSQEYENIMKLATKNVNTARAEFARQHRNDSWHSVFEKMEFRKWLDKKQTSEFIRDIKKNQNIPFTKGNMRATLENVFEQRGALFEKSVANIFDELTRYYDGNTNHKEGWKTNENYKVNQKIIFPYGCKFDTRFRTFEMCYYGSSIDIYNDLDRIMCVLDGKPFEKCNTVQNAMREKFKALGWHVKSPFDSECESDYFHIKFFMKGTVHLTFKDKDLWARFNKTASKGKAWLGKNT